MFLSRVHEPADVYKSPATELQHFHSCSCLNRGSLSSRAARFRSFRSRSSNFAMASPIVSSQGGIRVSIWTLRNFRLPQATILHWNRQCQTPRANSSVNLALTYHQNSVWTSIFFRMYCRSRVGMIEAKTAPGGIPTHGLTLCHRLVKRLILLYHIISDFQADIFVKYLIYTDFSLVSAHAP